MSKRSGQPVPSWASAVAGCTCLLLVLWTLNYRVGLPDISKRGSEVRLKDNSQQQQQQQQQRQHEKQQHEQRQQQHGATSLSHYKDAEVVMLAATNSAYLDWAFNWAKFCARLGVPHLVIAFDSDAAVALHMQDVPVHDASSEPGVPSTNIRVDFTALRRMSYLKIDIALRLLQQYRWQSVLLSDTDVAWLRHPAGLLQDYPHADVMVSTDCCSQKAVDNRQVDVPRCGAVPGAKVWAAWNSGVVLFRNTEPALAVIRDWRDRLDVGAPDMENGWWLDDQLTLSAALDQGAIPYASGDQTWDDTGTVLTFDKTTRTMPLPPLVVAGGHVAFEQRLPELLGVTPYALHGTFQEYQFNEGKKARFDENLLWLLHPPDHYQGKWITYDNLVETWIDQVAEVWQQHTGQEMVLFHKHFLAGAFQLQVLAEALQAAYVLQRALVPPRFVCYCWKDTSQMVDQLHTCSALGIDKQPPYHCNMDAFVDVEVMKAYSSLLRFPNFLDHEQVAPQVQRSSVAVRVVDYDSISSGSSSSGGSGGDGSTSRDTTSSGDSSSEAGLLANNHHPVFPLYAKDTAVLRALQKHDQAVLVHLGALAPGWLTGGLSDSKAQAAVQTAVEQLTGQASPWCCLTAAVEQQNMTHSEVRHQMPVIGTAKAAAVGQAVEAGTSLSSATAALLHAMRVGDSEWQPADEWFVRPAWCDEEGFLSPFNRNVSQWKQHPCSYLSAEVVGRLQLPLLKEQLLQLLRQVHRLRAAGSSVHSEAAAVPIS